MTLLRVPDMLLSGKKKAVLVCTAGIVASRKSVKQIWRYTFMPPCLIDVTKVRVKPKPGTNKRQDFVTCRVGGK